MSESSGRYDLLSPLLGHWTAGAARHGHIFQNRSFVFVSPLISKPRGSGAEPLIVRRPGGESKRPQLRGFQGAGSSRPLAGYLVFAADSDLIKS